MKRVVRVGVADSGINPAHRHVGLVADGVGINFVDGELLIDDDWYDQIGHGTAAAATICGHAPKAELYAIRIFRRRLETPVETLLYAIDWAIAHKLDILNLSLGCTDNSCRSDFVTVCNRALTAGLSIVSAYEVFGKASFPGSLPGVIAVTSDSHLAQDEINVVEGVIKASPWARQLGNLPKENNFHGLSFAVANVSGIVAGLLQKTDSTDGILSCLQRSVRCTPNDLK